MMAVAFDATLTWADDPPADGTTSGAPESEKNRTVKVAAVVPVLVKYSAEYQPPPKTNCGSTAASAVPAVFGAPVRSASRRCRANAWESTRVWPFDMQAATAHNKIVLEIGCFTLALVP